MRRLSPWFCLTAALALAACDSGSGSGNPGTGSPGPSPSPSSSPAPTPSPTPSPTGSVANLAGAQNNSLLRVRRACSTARPTYVNGVLSGIDSIGTVTLQAPETAQYQAPNTIVAFGDTFFRVPPDGFFTPFGSLSDFTLAFVNTTAASPPSATFGYTDRTTLCFFGAGLAPSSSALQPAYDGRADGLHQTGAGTRRLFDSTAVITMNAAARTGLLQINLAGYAGAFPTFTGMTPVSIGTLTANITVTGNEVTATSIAGLPGYSGSISGELVGPRGMVLVFELRDGAGSVLWGAAALDNAACAGCWDY